jgi:DNA-binding winged helix-turn-helix (wHTH) protein/TolB-like protein
MVGDRLVQPALNRIRGPQGEAHVEPKVMAVLVCLAEHAGEVVSRNAIYDQVWGRTLVSDQALTNCISELRQHLGDDRAEPRYIETVPKRGYRLVAPLAPAAAGADRPARRGRTPAYAAAGLLLAALPLLLLVWREQGTDRYEPLPSVVSVPFENVRGDAALDYLRLALPDEITTLLTRSPQLAVRPFEPGGGSDPLAETRTRTAAYVVAGHFYLEAGDRLAIAVEALDAQHDRLVWRARITVSAGDLLAMREGIADRVRDGLLPALGATPEIGTPEPSNAAAYRLYLHSLAISRDAGPNLHGIRMLEEAVRIDPAFSAAWSALAARYNYDAVYGDGGQPAQSRSREAALRALEEDPAQVDAAQQLVVLQVESGELAPAYRQARGLLDRRGRSADAHFALSYVLRYAGMLEDAERHCDIALALDPHNYAWRSCAFAFITDAKPARAAGFVALDQGSYWSDLVSVLLRLREGDRTGALRHARALPPEGADRRFLVACLQEDTGAVEASAAAFEHRWRRLRDPEPGYQVGAALALCGRTEAALGMLGHAIEGGYCAWPAMDRDPAWRPFRQIAEFRRLREEAIACRERFRTAAALAGGD